MNRREVRSRLTDVLITGAVNVLLMVGPVLAQTTPESRDKPGLILDQSVPVRMRDGVLLRADVYRPAEAGKFPVLLKRTPYGKYAAIGPGTRRAGMDWELEFIPKAVARGYVVIIQDSRGRHSSDGVWYPFREVEDGYDTVEWAATLPCSNGKVGTWGMSYNGWTQLEAAIGSPPHLAGIFPVGAGSDAHSDGSIYEGGAFDQSSFGWASFLAEDALLRRVQEDPNRSSRPDRGILPASDYSLLNVGNVNELAPYLFDWLAHPSYDDYWKEFSIEGHYQKITVPAYYVDGWYDTSVRGALRNYIGVKARGGSEAARHGQRVIVGPWPHTPPPYSDTKTGEVDFGPAARLDLDEVLLHWYDHLLKGIDNGAEREKPVKIFVMGKNTWRDESDWPLARARMVSYYLSSTRKANSASGDGVLSREPAKGTPQDHFLYDPRDPVPSQGSSGTAMDQRPVETRKDVLVYSTPPFNEEVEVTGPIRAELFASSSAVDTDFTARLVDVWPNGFVQNLTDGILRCRYRNSQQTPELMNPGDVYKLEIDLGATSIAFLTGHRLRLEISSSNFPRFARNLNTSQDPNHSTLMMNATNTIYHDPQHPSALILPIVPK